MSRGERAGAARPTGFTAIGAAIARALIRLLGGDTALLLALAALVGVGGGYGAIFFRLLVNAVRRLSFQGAASVADLHGLPWYWVLLVPAAGGLVVGPVIYIFAREARGHGVPEVMHAATNLGGRIRARVVIVKALASAATIGTGGSVGREGPIVQIAAGWGSNVARFLGLNADHRRILLACGASAGIAGTFNAPIAGVIFSVEIILGIGTVHVFSPLVVASVISTAVTRHYLGNTPAFVVPVHEMLGAHELILYLIMGTVIGAVGAIFTRTLYAAEDAWERFHLPAYLSPMVGGFAVGAIGIWLPEVFGTGYDTINQLIVGSSGPLLLLALFAAKAAATVTTLASGASGGVFAPSLFLGATLGGAFGALVHSIWPTATATAGAYSLIGMGAMVAGTTHASLTAILMLFEMTDSYAIILPLMLACIASVVVSTRISHGSIYTLKLLRRGDVLSEGTESDFLRHTTVSSVVRTKLPTLKPSAHFPELVFKLLDQPGSHVYVIDDEKHYLGMVILDEIKAMMSAAQELADIAVVLDVLRSDVPTLTLKDDLAHCIDLFTRTEVSELPVIDGQGRLIGRATHRDITTLYNRHVLRFGMLGLRYVVREATSDETPSGELDLRVPLGQRLIEVVVGGEFAGRTLRETDLRARLAVSAVGVRHHGGETIAAPEPGRPLAAGEKLLLVGTDEALEVARELIES